MNFIHAKINSPEMRESFFGPLEEGDEFVIFDDSWGWPDILVKAGCFVSKGDARRNISNIKGAENLNGWHEIEIGKKRRKLYVLGNFA